MCIENRIKEGMIKWILFISISLFASLRSCSSDLDVLKLISACVGNSFYERHREEGHCGKIIDKPVIDTRIQSHPLYVILRLCIFAEATYGYRANISGPVELKITKVANQLALTVSVSLNIKKGSI